jgi:hypothetical protein
LFHPAVEKCHSSTSAAPPYNRLTDDGTDISTAQVSPGASVKKDEIVRHGLPDTSLGSASPTISDQSGEGTSGTSGGTPGLEKLTNRVDALGLSFQEQALEVCHRLDSLESNLKSKATTGLFLAWPKIQHLLVTTGISPRSYVKV